MICNAHCKKINKHDNDSLNYTQKFIVVVYTFWIHVYNLTLFFEKCIQILFNKALNTL